MENSLGGFSSHSEIYDVAVIFDKEKGLAMALVKRFTNRAEFNRLIDNALVKE